MLVSVSCGFTPVQFAFGQPAAEPDTVDGADSTAGWGGNVRFPFFTPLPGIGVREPEATPRARSLGAHRLPMAFEIHSACGRMLLSSSLRPAACADWERE